MKIKTILMAIIFGVFGLQAYSQEDALPKDAQNETSEGKKKEINKRSSLGRFLKHPLTIIAIICILGTFALPAMIPLLLPIAIIAFVGFLLLSIGLFLIPIFGFVIFVIIWTMLFGEKTVKNGSTRYEWRYQYPLPREPEPFSCPPAWTRPTQSPHGAARSASRVRPDETRWPWDNFDSDVRRPEPDVQIGRPVKKESSYRNAG